MRRLQLYMLPFVGIVLLTVLLFCVPVYATEEEGEYFLTLNPGESCSTKDVWYGVYSVSETNIPSYSGWCKGCSGGSHLTYMEASSVRSSYGILVDGSPIETISSNNPSGGVVDFTAYSDRDSIISIPDHYMVSQTISCVGGRYDGGTSIAPCGYSTRRNITVSGDLKLYRRVKRPKILAGPSPASGCTDGNVTFTVQAENAVRFYWQKGINGNFSNIADGKASSGVTYSGCSTSSLNISGLRMSENGCCYRCVLVGERGEEVFSDPAVLNVQDVTGPVIRLSFSPSDKTTQPVTILIKATDADSGLADQPYYYLGARHREDSFTVSKCGNYEVIVYDAAGNKSSSSVSINNIYVPTPKPTTPPASNPTQSPQNPSSPLNPPTAVTPTPYNKQPTSVPTKTPTTVQQPSDKTPTKEAGPTTFPTAVPTYAVPTKTANTQLDSEDKKVVIQNLEDVEMQEMLTENTEELTTETVEAITEPSNSQQNRDYTSLILGLGLLLLLVFVLLVLAMIFVVCVETADEFDKWHFHSIRILGYKGGWILDLGELLEDFDRLRLKFGGLFMILSSGKNLTIRCAQGEEMTVEEIEKIMTVAYQQLTEACNESAN